MKTTIECFNLGRRIWRWQQVLRGRRWLSRYLARTGIWWGPGRTRRSPRWSSSPSRACRHPRDSSRCFWDSSPNPQQLSWIIWINNCYYYYNSYINKWILKYPCYENVQSGRMGCVPACITCIIATVVTCRVRNPACTARECPRVGALYKR